MIYSKKYIEYDFSFLKEITELMITDLMELNNTLAGGVSTDVRAQYVRNFYRSKITLNLIGNNNLLAKADQISEMLKAQCIAEGDQFLVDSFQHACNQEIKNLIARITYYESYLVSASR